MSGTVLARTTRLASLLVAAAVFAACGGGEKKSGGSDKSMAVTVKKAVNTPPGADPSVPDSLGGNGFEKIAAAQGWQTGTISDDQFKLVADPSAKKGGSISFSLTDFPATFRTMGKDANSDVTSFVTGNIYEPLITTNPMTLEFLPALATHWKIDADKQTFYYRINPNARWHDGYPVTAEDVVATYRLGSDSSILDPFQNSFNAEFDPPVAVSKYIVKVRSKELNWKNFLYFGGQSLLPAHEIGKMTGKEFLDKYQYAMPVGSGPYTVLPEDVKKGASVALTRVSDWWQKDDALNRGQNNFDKIKIMIVRDERLALEKFKKGELDIYFPARAQWWLEEFNYDDIKRGVVQKRKVFTDNPVGAGGFAFNTRKWPFDDDKVREAFVLLFNREQLLEKLMFNQYTIMDSYFANTDYANPNNPKYRFNADRAAQLLTEAGYTTRNAEGILVKDGKPLSIDMAISQPEERIITPVQQELLKAGIKLNLRTVDGTTKFKLVSERQFTVTYQAWTGLLYPNPIGSWSSKMADQSGSTNITGFKNPVVDELIERERKSFDQKERVQIIRTIDSILMGARHYALNWYGPYTRVVYWNKFGHPDFYIGKIGDWKSVFSLWWYDSEKDANVRKAMSDKSVKMEVGPTDVTFWPDFRKKQTAAPAATGAPADSQPSIK